MIKKFTILFSVFVLLLCLGAIAFGQETTGDIEITVKDPNGAVVPNVSITISSSNAAGFKRTVTTDENGSVRVIKISPGLYTITAAATSGFAEKVVPGVQVVLGKVTPVSVDLGVANVDPTTVTVNSTDVSPVDTTDSKIQTNITAETAELLPKGTNFASILKVSPATRPEPRSGQFQIDGASGSENTFIIDGQEVTNVRTGVLDANSNLPFQLVQEVQIKSSGFPAEYGGATGGVINVVTKGGGNQFRGEFGVIFRPSGLNALGRPTLFLNSFDFTVPSFPERFPQRRDNYYEFNPLANLSGPILKDKVWFRLGYNPQIFKQRRLIDYVDPVDRSMRTYPTQVYKFKEVDENTSLRIDSQPISRLNLIGTYTWNPISQEGGIPSWLSSLFPTPTDPAGCQAPVCQAGNLSLRGAAYLNQTGGRQNSQSVTGQANWTILNNLILGFRAGHYFLNEKLGTYGIGDSTIPRVTCSALSITPFPAGFGCAAGTNNGIQLVDNTLFDATTRNTFDVDATFITSFGGRHEFKGGYQYNGIANQVSSKFTDQIVFRSGWTIADYAVRPLLSDPNAFGAGLVRIFGTQGDVSSKNEGIFFQDKWQMDRLTLNLGLRTEREGVPSFAPGLPGMKFDFMDKLAPRLGGAFDLTGDGKTKVSVFYGWFYDRFKYELPRGSFGGDLFHDFFFELLPGDTVASLSLTNITGNSFRAGGACPGGTITPVFARVRCDIDYRVPSNAGLPITEAGGIDPNIKAFRQSEFTVTFERDLGRNFVFAGRFTRKEVLDVIEDAGFPNAQGSEFYIIGNPGQGLYAETAEAFGLEALQPQRRYDALEFRLDKYLSNDYQFNLNYTWGRLVGNYSGLASSDEDGRLSPNVNRFFDQPQAGWTVAGGPDNGVLSTDRPHVLKFSGSYTLDWKKRFGVGFSNTTDFGLFTTVQSGTPLTTVVDINFIDTIVLTKRGDMGRTEMFTGTDFSIRNRFKFGRDDRFTLVTEVDILNVFNEANELLRVNLIELGGFNVRGLISDAENNACDAAQNEQPCLIAGYKKFQQNGAPAYLTFASDPANRYILYNEPSAFQGPRQVRFGVRFLF